MALAKFGMMMTDARGKLGGHVFTKSRSGATIRTKVTPSNPRTAAQSLARVLFASLSSEWSNLDEEERAAWNGNVDLYQRTNVFGDAYLPSGKNLYVALNSNLSKISKPTIAVPSAPVNFPIIVATALDIDTSGHTFDITFEGSAPGSQFAFYIEATKPNSPGRYNFSGQYRNIYHVLGTVLPGASNIWDAYTAKFGSPAPGTKVSLRISLVSIETGQSSAPSIVTGLAVT